MGKRGQAAAVLLLAMSPIGAQTVDFNRDIRPILSDRCFACHGPDAARRQAGLRLDVDGGAKAVGTELLRRIAAEDAGERMPPASSGKPRLSAHEVEMLRTWIGQGAPWQKFWSFVPPRRPNVPPGTAKSAID